MSIGDQSVSSQATKRSGKGEGRTDVRLDREAALSEPLILRCGLELVACDQQSPQLPYWGVTLLISLAGDHMPNPGQMLIITCGHALTRLDRAVEASFWKASSARDACARGRAIGRVALPRSHVGGRPPPCRMTHSRGRRVCAASGDGCPPGSCHGRMMTNRSRTPRGL